MRDIFNVFDLVEAQVETDKILKVVKTFDMPDEVVI
jgi:hypothetical protein